MNRSHRLLRAVHRLRLDRLDAAEGALDYDAYAEAAAFDLHLRDLEGDGHVDSGALFDATAAVVDGVFARVSADLSPGGLGDRVAEILVQASLARRTSSNGRPRLGGRDGNLTLGSSALAQAAILDRVYRAMAEIMRRRATIDHRVDPCWPERYLKRRAEAEGARLGVSGGVETTEGGTAAGGAPPAEGN